MVLSKKELGQLLKQARRLKSERDGKLYTQKMLASDIGKSQSYIGDIESGRTYPSFVLLNKIALACQVSMSFFDPAGNLDSHIDKFIKLQLKDTPDSDINEIKQHIKNDPELRLNHVYDYIKDAEEAFDFFLSQRVIQDFLEIDFNKLSPGEIAEFKADVLNQFKLISYKYKK